MMRGWEEKEKGVWVKEGRQSERRSAVCCAIADATGLLSVWSDDLLFFCREMAFSRKEWVERKRERERRERGRRERR